MSPSSLFLVLALVVVAVQASLFCPTTDCKECFSLLSIDDAVYTMQSSSVAWDFQNYGCPPEVNRAAYSYDEEEQVYNLGEYVRAACWSICGAANWATDPEWKCAQVDYNPGPTENDWADNVMSTSWGQGNDYRFLCVDGPKCAAGWNNCHEFENFAWDDNMEEGDYTTDTLTYTDLMEFYYWYSTTTYDTSDGIPTNKFTNLYTYFATYGGDGCESNTKCCPGGTDVSVCTDLYPNVDTYVCNAYGACGVGICSKVNGVQMGNCDGNELNGCEANLTSVATCGPSCTDCWTFLDDGYGQINWKKRMDEYRVVDWQCKNYTCAPVCMTGSYDCDGDLYNGCESFYPCCRFDEDCSQAGLPEHTAAYCMEANMDGDWAEGQHGTCNIQCQDNFVDCNNDMSDGCETYTERSECGWDLGHYFVDTNSNYQNMFWRDSWYDDTVCEYFVCCRARGIVHPSDQYNPPDYHMEACKPNHGSTDGSALNNHYSCDDNHACIYRVGIEDPAFNPSAYCDEGYWNCDGEFYNGCESTAPCCDYQAGNNFLADNCAAKIDAWWGCCGEPFNNLNGNNAYYCNEYHACTIGVCDENYGDCDGDIWNGCESDLRVDNGNCGSCGNVCHRDWSDRTMIFPQPTCRDGECTARHCNNGHSDPTRNFYDCNNDPNDGCESNTKCCQTDADCKNAIPFSFVATYKCNQETHSCEVATCAKDGHGQQRYNCDIRGIDVCNCYGSGEGWNGRRGCDCWNTADASDAVSFAREVSFAHSNGCESTTPCCDVHYEKYEEYYYQIPNNCAKYFPHIGDVNDLSCDDFGACYWYNYEYETLWNSPGDSGDADTWQYMGYCEVDDQGIQWFDCDSIWQNGCESRVECCVTNAVITDYVNDYDTYGYEDEADPAWTPAHAGLLQNHEFSGFCDLKNVGEYTCNKGACAVGKCMTGTADCDGQSWNGCEMNTASNPNNCGACGNSCSKNFASAAHVANWGCNGKCIPICATGFKDCNNNVADGCEFTGTNCSAPQPAPVPTSPAAPSNTSANNLVSSSGVVTALLSLVLAVLLL